MSDVLQHSATDQKVSAIPIKYRAPRYDLSSLPDLTPNNPYVIITPTYTRPSTQRMSHVPVQVLKWVTDIGPEGRALCRGVVGMGNTNFGADYARGGRQLAQALRVPLVGVYELSGMPGDAEEVAQQLQSLEDQV